MYTIPVPLKKYSPVSYEKWSRVKNGKEGEKQNACMVYRNFRLDADMFWKY